MSPIPKPQLGDYAPYASIYIDLLQDDGRVLDVMQQNLDVIQDIARSQSAEALITPHAPGEWTIQEILGHVMDTERVVAYRALRIARGDTTPLPGFEHNDYVPLSGANARSIDSLLDEYTAVRQATLSLFNNLPDEALSRAGTASNQRLTVNAAAYFIAGHELHHIRSIRENYL